LVALGSRVFKVEEIDEEIHLPLEATPPMLIITTNKERELPKAFMRRCLVLELKHPYADRLVAIAIKQLAADYPDPGPEQLQLYNDLATRVVGEPESDRPSTAEYLDALRACIRLGVRPDNKDDTDTWQAIEQTTLHKQTTSAGTP
jgi:MoxR-like ATPase